MITTLLQRASNQRPSSRAGRSLLAALLQGAPRNSVSRQVSSWAPIFSAQHWTYRFPLACALWHESRNVLKRIASLHETGAVDNGLDLGNPSQECRAGNDDYLAFRPHMQQTLGQLKKIDQAKEMISSSSEAPDRKKAAIAALDKAREQEVANADKVDRAVDMVLKRVHERRGGGLSAPLVPMLRHLIGGQYAAP